MLEIEAVRLQLKQLAARAIETPRLRLRQFTPDDAKDLYRIYSDPELFKYMSNEKPLLWKQTRGFIGAWNENWKRYNFGVWAIVYKKNKKLIGHCGLKFLENTSEVQIGYLLLKSYWGRGLGTEAAAAALKYGFEVIELPKIVAIAKPANIASRRVMEKIGMKYEKEAFYYENDVVYYSIYRAAYLSTSNLLKQATDNQNSFSPIRQPLCFG
ncbi:MAG TPA: GNAT family N-acetyltransferase [Coleofasciculaceae cyanobacterium]